MRIQNRTTIVEQFSTFLVLRERQDYIPWQTDPRLKRSIEQLIKSKQTDAELIAQTLLQSLRQNANKQWSSHLSAYLQEACFWATQKAYNRLASMTNFLTWGDYFSFGLFSVAQPLGLLKSYQPHFGSRITTYAQRKIEDRIADTAYGLMGWKRASDWGLLRKMSNRRRREALQQVGGLSGAQFERHLLAWQCFEAIYVPTKSKNSRQLPSPTAQQLQQMAEQFNYLRHNLKQAAPEVSPQELNTILTNCIKAARQYSNPQHISYPDNFDVPDPGSRPVESLEQEQLAKVNQVLKNAIASLSREQQTLLQLWKGSKLTQQEIIKVMASQYPNFVTKQYQVARQLDKCRKLLLTALVKEQLKENSKLTKEDIALLKAPLDLWLEEYVEF